MRESEGETWLTSVKVWHDKDVELAWVLDQLHAAVVDDFFLKLQLWVLGGHGSAALEEEPVRLLHDVGLVDRRDLLSAEGPREVETRGASAEAAVEDRGGVRTHLLFSLA